MPEHRSLISCAALAERLGDPGLAVLEVARAADESQFLSAHVPGSRWAFWKALLWHETDRSFPDPATLGRRLAELGIGGEATLVLSGDPIQFATYAFWVLTMLGRRDVLVLDGGRRAWLDQGMPVEAGPPAPPGPQVVAPVPQTVEDAGARVGRDAVLEAVRRGAPRILDLRSPEEYRGERVTPSSAPFDHGAERRGHVPGAVHLHFERLLRQDGTFRSPGELRAVFAEAGVGPEDEVIAYCRLSHRASLGWFARTELLGEGHTRVYDGSWTEWGSIVGVPIELEAAR